MNNFALLIKKELWENWVNWKIAIILVFFMALGILSPYSSYQNALLSKEMFESHLNSPLYTDSGLGYTIFAGNLVGQLFFYIALAVVIIVPLMLMGTVAHEVKSGRAASILVKPVGRMAYILSKFVVYLSIFCLAITSAILIGAIYANSVADIPIDMGKIWQCIGLSLVFAFFCISFILFLSSITKNQLAAGGVGLILLFMMAGFMYSPEVIFEIMPSKLMDWCQHIVDVSYNPWPGMIEHDLEKYYPPWTAFGVSGISPVILIAFSVMLIKRKEL